MNHLFSAHIGRIMDVYLDDIVVYSDTLSKTKLRFIAPEIDLLGRILDDKGIRMDPNKVDCVLNWKTPTNRDLLRGFLGSVGGDTVPFRWTYTEQRA